MKDEVEQKSFTNVFITGLHENHVSYLRNNFERVCRQLAHIYHYYLHGPLGNVDSSRGVRPASPFRNIDIQVVMYDKGKSPVQISLRDTEDDMQTLYIRSAPSVFEFKAGNVEGILRYHPFLYDQESYPALDSELTPGEYLG